MKNTKIDLNQLRQNQTESVIPPKDIAPNKNEVTRPTDLKNLYPKSHAVNDQSKSLSMSVAEHLLFLMKEVVKNEVDPKSVNAACNCATQMINLMKLNIKLRD